MVGDAFRHEYGDAVASANAREIFAELGDQIGRNKILALY
jgi:hypothetical protein